MDNDRVRIGNRISEIRRLNGLTVRELAEKCGVTYQNINKIENGKYSVGIDVLSKIADGLGCKVDFVLYNKI